MMSSLEAYYSEIWNKVIDDIQNSGKIAFSSTDSNFRHASEMRVISKAKSNVDGVVKTVTNDSLYSLYCKPLPSNLIGSSPNALPSSSTTEKLWIFIKANFHQ